MVKNLHSIQSVERYGQDEMRKQREAVEEVLKIESKRRGCKQNETRRRQRRCASEPLVSRRSSQDREKGELKKQNWILPCMYRLLWTTYSETRERALGIALP